MGSSCRVGYTHVTTRGSSYIAVYSNLMLASLLMHGRYAGETHFRVIAELVKSNVFVGLVNVSLPNTIQKPH